MKRLVYLFLALCAASCASSGPKVRPAGSVDAGSGGDVHEMTRDEFERIENLRDDPIDPRRAQLEELLSIPGFPPGLARAVVRAREASGRGSGWINRLSPPDREALYRFSLFLALPARRRATFKARMVADGSGGSGPARHDSYASLRGEGYNLLIRGRLEGTERYLSLYTSTRLLDGTVRIHAGDFMPDVAMGLVFSSYSNDYPFSGGYPLRGYRWVAGRTSLYGTSLRGGAAEVWKGSVRAMAFAGRPRSYLGGECRRETQSVGGSRIEIDLGPCSLGSTAYHDPLRGGLIAFDGRWKSGVLTAGIELAAGARRHAVTASASYSDGGVGGGVILHSFPSRFINRFGASPHSGGGGVRGGRGIGIVVSRSLGRSFAVRGAFDRYVRCSASESLLRDVLRCGIEKKRGRFAVDVYLTSKRYGTVEHIPFPARENQSAVRIHTVKANLVAHYGGKFRFKIAGSCLWGHGHDGYQLSPSIDLRRLCRRVDVTVFLTAFRTTAGEPVFYYYEPTPEGSYPWRTARGNGCRGVFSASLSVWKLLFSLWSAVGRNSPAATKLWAVIKV